MFQVLVDEVESCVWSFPAPVTGLVKKSDSNRFNPRVSSRGDWGANVPMVPMVQPVISCTSWCRWCLRKTFEQFPSEFPSEIPMATGDPHGGMGHGLGGSLLNPSIAWRMRRQIKCQVWWWTVSRLLRGQDGNSACALRVSGTTRSTTMLY